MNIQGAVQHIVSDHAIARQDGLRADIAPSRVMDCSLSGRECGGRVLLDGKSRAEDRGKLCLS